MKNIQKIGLGLGATALVLGGAAGFAGIAQAADPTADPTPAATTPAAGQQQGWGRAEMRGEMRGGMQAAQLAEKLGLDEDKVADALQAAHDALREAHQADDTTTRPTLEERRAELAAELAKALGVNEATVTEALTALDAERDATRAAALQDRLDQAVTDGKLTQTEADAVKKAVEAGVIGGGGPGGPGGPGGHGKGMGRGNR
ncbi:hypothetical protein H5397_06440 [Propioniciclava sp. MC1683]|uniref:hypothetical protein n=1 Tax=Propioniciclava sp. MC1683 TaxID=2760309 RepID=UPI0016021D61|nr:hypothetical protein [Propioniciclava sp. MC1683]MBB1501071.1 hypothetical protein [Propioniciclava sp. MC1683]